MSNYLLRKGIGALALLMLLAGVAPLAARADTATTTASTTPAISGILASSTDTGATITWTTDVPATSQVIYGTTLPYNIFSAIQSLLTTGHSVSLSALTPGTLYHFAVVSDASSTASSTSATASTSPDMTFTTTNTASSTASTTMPVISSIASVASTTSATITWMTDQPSSSQVLWGTTTSYGSTSPLDSGQVTGHAVTITGLTPSTLYHFRVWSGIGSSTAASSSDRTFTTAVVSTSTGTTTGTPTSADIQALQLQITALQQQINQLWALVQSLLGGGGGNGTTTPPVTGNASIDQNGTSVNAGGGIDFGGHNFGKEEHVNVMLGGSKVGEGFTNQGGGFSTGSMSVPTTPGTYTYTFVGQNSGITAQATITVH